MTQSVHLRFNEPAPDLLVLQINRKPLKLSSLWHRHAVLLAFTRHFGCPQCKEMMEELVQASRELRKSGLELVFITQGLPEDTAAFCAKRAGGWLCLSDPSRMAYAAYGLIQANLWQTFLSPRVWLSNLHLWRRRGWRTEAPPAGQDAMQLAGLFVIGTDGRIRLPYYYDDIADHPPLDLILHGILGVDWKRPLEGPLLSRSTKSKRNRAESK